MKTFFFVFLLILLSLQTSFAKGKHKDRKRHSFSVKLSVLQGINNNNDVQHFSKYGELREKMLTIDHRPGWQAGLEYQYINRKKYSFTLGISYGVRQLGYKWNFNYDRFDLARNIGFDGFEHSYTGEVRYASLSFMFGRNYYPFKNKNIAIQTKLGLSYMRVKDHIRENVAPVVIYEANDSLFGAQFAATHIDNEGNPFYYTLYLGGYYSTKRGIIKNYTIGISFIHAFNFFVQDEDSIGEVTGDYFQTNNQIRLFAARDVYEDRFRNIALTIGVGF